MIIIGADYHPGFQQIAFVDTDTGESENGDWSTARRRRSSTVIWRHKGRGCAWGWKPAGMRVGLNVCWRS